MPPDQLASWLALWVDTAPGNATPVLDARLLALGAPDDARFAEEFIVALMGGRRQSGSINGAWKTPAYLKSIYVLMHRSIRVCEDLNRADGGCYSPTMRDDAQDARNTLFNLLSSTPGQATYREILALADDHPEPSYRPYMGRRAHDRAVEDSDREWSLNDVLALAPDAAAAR